MGRRRDLTSLQRRLTARQLAVGFVEDRKEFGLGAAVERLRIGLKASGLWLGEKDEALLAAILNGQATDEAIDTALDAPERYLKI